MFFMFQSNCLFPPKLGNIPLDFCVAVRMSFTENTILSSLASVRRKTHPEKQRAGSARGKQWSGSNVTPEHVPSPNTWRELKEQISDCRSMERVEGGIREVRTEGSDHPGPPDKGQHDEPQACSQSRHLQEKLSRCVPHFTSESPG